MGLDYNCMLRASKRGGRALPEEKASLVGGEHEQQCRVARAGYEAPLELTACMLTAALGRRRSLHTFFSMVLNTPFPRVQRGTEGHPCVFS